MQVLHSYLRYTDRLLDVLFLLLAVILAEFQTKKVRLSHRKKYIELLEEHPSSYVIFYRFFRLFPLPSRMTYWFNGPYKET